MTRGPGAGEVTPTWVRRMATVPGRGLSGLVD
jgi:hypothetical protein